MDRGTVLLKCDRIELGEGNIKPKFKQNIPKMEERITPA